MILPYQSQRAKPQVTVAASSSGAVHGQQRPPPVRRHDNHVADWERPGHRDTEVIEQLDTARADEVAAGLLAWEPPLVNEGDLRPARARTSAAMPPGSAPTTMAS